MKYKNDLIIMSILTIVCYLLNNVIHFPLLISYASILWFYLIKIILSGVLPNKLVARIRMHRYGIKRSI